MFYIYEGAGSNPRLLGILSKDEHSKDSCQVLSATASHKVNNPSDLELVIDATHEINELITDTSDVVLFDTYGNPQEYHVTEIEDVHEDTAERTLYCEGSIVELNDSIIEEEMANISSTNPRDYLAHILQFTRWEIGEVDEGVYNSKWEAINELVGSNCLNALNEFLKKYNCEFSCRYVLENNVITRRILDIKTQIGKNVGKRFEYEKDVNSIKRHMDSSNVKTAIFPRIVAQGEADEKGNQEVIYTTIENVYWSTAQGNPVNKELGSKILVNTLISEKYTRLNGQNGRSVQRTLYAEWTPETCENDVDLINQAWRILQANSVPKLNYECNASDLYILTGDTELMHEHVELGDTAVIIDKTFKQPIRVRTRIMELTENLLQPSDNNFVFGDTKETISTSNIKQQISIEEQLKQLQNKLPEYKLPFQSGKPFYESIKEQLQEQLVKTEGYTMIEDSNGLWVFDRPADQNPTKAVIVKGGCIGLSKYNKDTQTWELGTFIDGLSVNADFINTGHLKGDIIEAHSIKADKLSVEAINFIKTGLVTEGELDTVVDGLKKVESDLKGANDRIDGINNTIEEALSGALDASKLEVIKNNLLILKNEYNSIINRANETYLNKYLAGESKLKLDQARTDFTTAYNSYVSFINTIIEDNVINNDEFLQFQSKAEAYEQSLLNLTKAIEKANTDILNNVYAQARQGLVTKTELEVNNEKVVIKAQQGMVTTEDMTEQINLATKDLVTNGKLEEAVNGVIGSTPSHEDISLEVTKGKLVAIRQVYEGLVPEYNNNLKQAQTLYKNESLTEPAKGNLMTAKNEYMAKFTALDKVIQKMEADVSVDEAHMLEYKNALKEVQDTVTILGQRMQEAVTNINTNIQNANKQYADGLKQQTDASIGEVSGAVDTLRNDVNTTIKDGIINEAEALSIKSNIKVLNTEKADIDKEVADLLGNSNLNGGAKTDLTNKHNLYNTAHQNLINTIETSTADKNVTDEEKTQIDNKFTEYGTALTNLRGAIQNAIDVITLNKINGATQGFINSEQMNSAINGAIQGLPSIEDVNSAENNAYIRATIEAIKHGFEPMTNEYNSNVKQTEETLKNSYLTGTTRDNLDLALGDYKRAYELLNTSVNDIVTKGTITEEQMGAYNSALTELKTKTTILAQRLTESLNFINMAVYNAGVKYFEDTIPDKLTGYSKVSYVDDAMKKAVEDAKKGMVSNAEMEVNNNEILFTTSKMGLSNILYNSDFRNKTSNWAWWGSYSGLTARDLSVVKGDNAYEWCIVGERALTLSFSGLPTATEPTNLGFYQTVKDFVPNTSYTFSYWVAHHRCDTEAVIFAYRPDGSYYEVITKDIGTGTTYGGKDRKGWKFDSLSFTVPADATRIDVGIKIKKVYSGNEYPPQLWLIKPMLCQGINAQPWSGHPSEMYLGVVSITEEHGLKVEHSHSKTYSTMNSEGFKVWDYSTGKPIASFGENETAVIKDIQCQRIISPYVKGVGYINNNVTLHFSNTGSGDYSGRDANNCAQGFGGVMQRLLSIAGLDPALVKGNFSLISNDDVNYWVDLQCHGSNLEDDIVLTNIDGDVAIYLTFDSTVTMTGRIWLSNINSMIVFNGNRTWDVNNGMLIKRNDNDFGIVLNACRYVEILNLRLNSTGTTVGYSAIYLSRGSTVYCYGVDICNFNVGFEVKAGSRIHTSWVLGSGQNYSMTVRQSTAHSSGSYLTTSGQYTDGGIYHDADGLTRRGTMQGGLISTTKTVTATFGGSSYRSDRSYSVNELIQSSWGSSYGDYVGRVWFSGAREWLKDATNITAQIYLQRTSSGHGYNSGAKVKICGYDVGTLDLGQGKWFTIPNAVVEQLKSGALDHIYLDGKGGSYYIKFEKNAKLWFQATKTV